MMRALSGMKLHAWRSTALSWLVTADCFQNQRSLEFIKRQFFRKTEQLRPAFA
jgi:hypothetical protein